jgi:4-amino-4-deoxy-L-arabinose transferase-like glycosyltransferase
MTNDKSLNDRLFAGLLGVAVLINLSGLLLPVLESDGTLYGQIARTMVQTGDYTNLIVRNRDWLDKPHFPFWITALSFRLFGVSNWAYKLPALVFFGAGVGYTYWFARLRYSRLVAQVAVLVLLTPYHIVLSNNDVRAEPYLTGAVIGAVFHFYRLSLRGCWYDLWLGAAWTGCALMTKGPFVLVPIGAGLVLHWVLTGQWRELLRPRWYAAVGLSAVFALPEIWCLYQQFDARPQAVVFGRTGVSGVKFFFWDSQFGRFFNTGPIKGAGEPTFFLHTLLWAFLPWSLPLYAAVGRAVGRLVRVRTDGLPEWVSLGSGLATFVLFSASGFQLPHYMNIVYPFFAVLTAWFLVGLSPAGLQLWVGIQTGVAVLLVGVGVALPVWMQQPLPAVPLVLAGAALTGWLFRRAGLAGLLGRSLGGAVLAFAVVNLVMFPLLFRYQAGMQTARFLNDHPAMRPAGVYRDNSYAFEFYLNAPVQFLPTDSLLVRQLARGPVWVYTQPANLDSLQQRGYRVRPAARFRYFPISQPTPAFLNPTTRQAQTLPFVVAEIRR